MGPLPGKPVVPMKQCTVSARASNGTPRHLPRWSESGALDRSRWAHVQQHEPGARRPGPGRARSGTGQRGVSAPTLPSRWLAWSALRHAHFTSLFF